ncbi:putative exported phage protein [Burkholderia aenigmatica]|uniref:glycosyl hydrolase family 28-related protein n=1 Tax=Burkholderia aenigmatica TaxID=2015348 RepID=UPI001453488D|nr:glycosyl hydrolase family 28-related protein [Burkholderia aenigmatica]VWD60999.1 putative exported phage protein [Burkholderia aenigmatica]
MASILPNGKTQFIDASGKPLVGGTVTFYLPGTTTKKDTYQDAALTQPNTNPVVLDSKGQATIWGNGSYRQVTQDVFGAVIWDQVISAATSSDALAGSTGSSLIGTPDGSTLANTLLLGLNRVVDSIAALRATNSTFFSRAFVTGYYAPRDGGGGAYQLDPSDTTSADNGGSIIVANDGGRWKLQVIGGRVSVKQFGAKLIGGDDTVYIKAAIAAASASTEFKEVFVDPGSCLISDTLLIHSAAVRLIGSGSGGYHDAWPNINATTRFIWAGAANGICVQIRADSNNPTQWVANNAVKGIFFDGNNALGGIAVNLVSARYGEYSVSGCHWSISIVQMDIDSAVTENGTCTGNLFELITGYQTNPQDGSFLICNSNPNFNCCWNTYTLIQGNWSAKPMIFLNGNDNDNFMTINGYNSTPNVNVYGIVCNGGPSFFQATRHCAFYHVSTAALGGGGVFVQGTDHAVVAAYSINILYYDIDNNQANPVAGPGASVWWSTNNAPSAKQAFFFTSPPGFQEIDNAGKIKIAGVVKISSGQTSGTFTFPIFPGLTVPGFPNQIVNVQVTPSTQPIMISAFASTTALTVTASSAVPADIYLYFTVEGQ